MKHSKGNLPKGACAKSDSKRHGPGDRKISGRPGPPQGNAAMRPNSAAVCKAESDARAGVIPVVGTCGRIHARRAPSRIGNNWRRAHPARNVNVHIDRASARVVVREALLMISAGLSGRCSYEEQRSECDEGEEVFHCYGVWYASWTRTLRFYSFSSDPLLRRCDFATAICAEVGPRGC